MSTGIIIQARMGSTRLPGKVLKEVLGKPLLWYLLERAKKCVTVEKIVVATSISEQDQVIEDFCQSYGIECFRGSEDDVLDRYYQCALVHKMGRVVRITGDCPLSDPELIDDVVRFSLENVDFDLVKTGPTYPEGFDAETLSFENLERAWKEAERKSQREHVTTFLWENEQQFKIKWLSMEEEYPFLRLTVDEAVDFEVVKAVIEELNGVNKGFFGLKDILALHEKKPDIFKKNRHIIRNEGYLKSRQED